MLKNKCTSSLDILLFLVLVSTWMTSVLGQIDSLLTYLDNTTSSMTNTSTCKPLQVIVNENDHGGPEKLILNPITIPTPNDDEILIQVKACGINFIDTYHRSGLYPGVTKIGKEGSGIVLKMGKNVTNFQINDKVLWWSIQGSYATHVIAKPNQVIKIPQDVFGNNTDENEVFGLAASIGIQGLTAHYLVNSVHRSKISSNDRVLVHAGAGGTGGLVIQMLKILGCKCIITTVSTEDKAKIAKNHGADHVILYTKENFVERVKNITNNQLCNVVIDGVGKTTWEGSLQCTAVRGTLIYFGNASGPVPAINPLRLTKQGSVMMTRPTLRSFLLDQNERNQRVKDIFTWIKNGQLKIRIGHRIPLQDVVQAHKMLESRKTNGKVLLIP